MDQSRRDFMKDATRFIFLTGPAALAWEHVLAGTPDHRDQLLSEAERAAGDIMMICCSRCQGDSLTLDL